MTQDAINAVSTVQTITPKAPDIPDAERVTLEARGTELAKRVIDNPDDLTLIESVRNLGAKAQSQSSLSIKALQMRTGMMLNQLQDEGGIIPKGLMDLRAHLEEINPHALSEPKWYDHVFGWLPFYTRLNPDKIMLKIASRYQTVQQQIDGVMNNLRDGKDKLLLDNIELQKVAEDVKPKLTDLEKNAYLAELTFKQLSEAQITEPSQKSKVLDVTNDIAIRCQDLRIMEQADVQFLVSIGMTMGNNNRLAQTVDRTIEVTSNIIQIGLAIQLALDSQRRVLTAVRDTQEYAANVLAQNAKDIRQQTQEIGDLYKNPVIAMEKVKEAFDDLMASMDEADSAKTEGIELAKKGITEVDDMTGKLKNRALSMNKATTTSAINSIEA
jgi:uncharacterized protein YaaN involved in tellurite resistance